MSNENEDNIYTKFLQNLKKWKCKEHDLNIMKISKSDNLESIFLCIDCITNLNEKSNLNLITLEEFSNYYCKGYLGNNIINLEKKLDNLWLIQNNLKNIEKDNLNKIEFNILKLKNKLLSEIEEYYNEMEYNLKNKLIEKNKDLFSKWENAIIDVTNIKNILTENNDIFKNKNKKNFEFYNYFENEFIKISKENFKNENIILNKYIFNENFKINENILKKLNKNEENYYIYYNYIELNTNTKKWKNYIDYIKKIKFNINFIFEKNRFIDSSFKLNFNENINKENKIKYNNYIKKDILFFYNNDQLVNFLNEYKEKILCKDFKFDFS